MPSLVFITGPAGSGKTTRLLERTADCAEQSFVQEHQKVLAMAYMHGARRRLETSLSATASCAHLPRRVTTIDGFSLELLNRWRTALGFKWPFVPTAGPERQQPFERAFRTHASFEQINQYAAELLGKPMIATLVTATYPIVVIDEFQDCVGARLDVVQALARTADVILAADEFQLLDDTAGCPAIDWVKGLTEGVCTRESLTGCHRTSKKPILDAALSLRENRRVACETVPVFYGRPAQLVYRIMERLTGWGWSSKWGGQAVLLSPVHKALDEVLTELAHQSTKRNIPVIRWTRHNASELERYELFNALGIQEDLDGDYTVSHETERLEDTRMEEVLAHARRFSRLRGLQSMPKHVVAHFAESHVHASRAYGHSTANRIATTVYGAKNCEFDNVFVLWPYGVTGNAEKRRRLLYNAITRAKNHCVVLDLRNKAEVERDEVMYLLGNPKPVFERKAKQNAG